MKASLTHQNAARLLSSEAPLTLGIRRSTMPLERQKLQMPDDLACFSSAPPDVLTEPLHLMVASRSLRIKAKGCHFHYDPNPLPPEAFVTVGDAFLCVCPELCFAQMSGYLSLVELIRFGIELCSTYVPQPSTQMDPAFAARVLSREALTTSERLKQLAPTFGVGNSRAIASALRWIVDGSASPRETALYLLLCLPYRLGGYALPKPAMNYEIPLSPEESRMANRSLFRADLYWPDQRIDVEYDSTQYHLNEARMETDSIRRNVLNHKGIRVINVTRNQMNSTVAFDAVARQIGNALGKRIQIKQQTFYERRRELRKIVIGRD